MTDTDATTELINLKSKIEQENSGILEERSKLVQKLKLVRFDKESERAKNGETYEKLVLARLGGLSDKRRVDNMADHVEWQKQENELCDQGILEQLTLPAFSSAVEQTRASIESAMNFYSEESLNMELMKRNSANRDIRVELTRISQEIQQRKKELEAELEEKKRIEQAKLERQRQEEERKRLIAEEKARMTTRYQSPIHTPEPTLNNFRTVSFANGSPDQPPPHKQSLSREGAMSPELEPSAKGRFNTSLPSFSQLTKFW